MLCFIGKEKTNETLTEIKKKYSFSKQKVAFNNNFKKIMYICSYWLIVLYIFF